ncbi:uncharacterized protein LOC143445665 [Clavelina lepadiformis]|uniref:uncharacterized protein LOC143445665 n=1 Tax=Clavelina lepadiformis TaxID=159417 RepID=UPI00404131FB
MLLYIESKAYPDRTFIDICKPSDTVARIRAYLLHRLHEIGHSNHQFRLRYKGTYLRDAYTLEEYNLLNNAVIHMVPLSDVSEWNTDKRFRQSTLEENSGDVEDIVQVALRSEIKLLDKRERILNNFKILMMMQIVLVFLSLFTNYWYFFFAYLFVLAVALFFSPSFTRVNGWVGTNSMRRNEFMVVMVFLSCLMVGAGVALLTLNVMELTASSYPTDRCISQSASCITDANSNIIKLGVCTAYEQRCYESSVWTGAYYCLVIMFMASTGVLSAFLLHNFKFNPGDYIERYLVQTREFEQIMETARTGSISQKRNAAFELATMASSADDNKFQIVTDGGLDVLITLALSADLTTQEYATEALAECLTVPAIQDQFISLGGAKTLTALLHSKNLRTAHEAITAISYIVADSDENKFFITSDHGIDDLLHACKYANAPNRKILASIFLELAYFADTRAVMASKSTSVEAMIFLLVRSTIRSREISNVDIDTTVLALQTLELLAIESPSLVASQEDFLSYLLTVPIKILDQKIQLLTTKLLLYFTKTPEALEQLCMTSDLTDKLLYFAHSNDPELLNALSAISLHVTEPFKHRERLVHDGFLEFLTYLQNASNERESWNMADQAISNLQNKQNPDDDVKKPITRPPTAMTSSASRSSSVVLLRDDNDATADQMTSSEA